MTIGWILVISYTVVGLILSFLSGFYPDGDNEDTRLFILFWPMIFIIVIVIAPFYLVYLLGKKLRK